MKHRLPVLLLLLAATLMLVLFAPAPDDGVVAPRAHVAPVAFPLATQGGGSQPPLEEAVLRLRDRSNSKATPFLFEVRRPSAPAVEAAFVPEPKPLAPPLPFRVLGKYQDADEVTVFLEDAGKGLPVKVGDLLHNDTYRIDAISDEEIQFTYVPLQQKQALPLGDAP
ncbi:MAG: hypothetical protein K0Q68_203 [Moraxellaceae bacterium]|jgi:hypothetical protein|nr:hypothetical protein [Moraxellaceae bacterium]